MKLVSRRRLGRGLAPARCVYSAATCCASLAPSTNKLPLPPPIRPPSSSIATAQIICPSRLALPDRPGLGEDAQCPALSWLATISSHLLLPKETCSSRRRRRHCERRPETRAGQLVGQLGGHLPAPWQSYRGNEITEGCGDSMGATSGGYKWPIVCGGCNSPPCSRRETRRRNLSAQMVC